MLLFITTVKCEMQSKGLDNIRNIQKAVSHLPAEPPAWGYNIHSETTVDPTHIHFPCVIDINYLSAAMDSILHAWQLCGLWNLFWPNRVTVHYVSNTFEDDD